MKNKLLIAAAAAAGAALVAYLVKRSRTNTQIAETITAKRSHHLTNVFAHAKNHSHSAQ